MKATLDFGSSRILDVDIDTIRRGDQTITVRYRSPSRPTIPTSISNCHRPTRTSPRLPVTVARVSSASGVLWRSDGLIVPAAGKWKVTVRFDGGGPERRGPKLASFGVSGPLTTEPLRSPVRRHINTTEQIKHFTNMVAVGDPRDLAVSGNVLSMRRKPVEGIEVWWA